MDYLDSGSGRIESTLGAWLERALAGGARDVRIQSGYFGFDALAAHAMRLRELARRGGVLHIVLGANRGALLPEDLTMVLALIKGTKRGQLRVVRFKDALFHPKVIHLARSDGSQVAVVGSANFTASGLGHNVEACLALSSPPEPADLLRQIAVSVDRWIEAREEAVHAVRSREDIVRLLKAGVISDRIREEEPPDRVPPPAGESRTPLPSRRRLWTPPRRMEGRGPGGRDTTGSGLGEVLLMRVRHRRDGNQIQISTRVHRGAFMQSAKEVISSADGTRRPIGDNQAKNRGAPRNTVQFQAPGLKRMKNPVARFHWVHAGASGRKASRELHYEIFDADSDDGGARIFEKLRTGITTPPVLDLQQLSQRWTVLSKADPMAAQWYRLDLA